MGDGKAQQAERRLVGQSGKPPGPLGAILREFGRADGALTLGELAGRLGIERSALDGMIRLLVRKGRLRRADGPG
ncbi:MAG: helix-turn-helix domain-containing protein, partial [Gemmatimonadetes bacterium]|nr:helix-turn-helix domain-containing protein [Gemmatimonadota bacterium]